MKKFIKILLSILAVIIAVAAAYVVYVFAAYYRLEDNLPLEPENTAKIPQAETDTEYKIITYNIGFGAYEADYSFFMDGGEHSWALSEDRLKNNIAAIGEFISEEDADIILLQEVDENGTRTYHYNEREYFRDKFNSYQAVWAQNWDSPFLFYPFTEPHGKNIAGILTLSEFAVKSAVRRSLPIEDNVYKIVDLDRCYSKSRISVNNGRELVLYNAHLSAYTSDGTIAEEQIKMLVADMTEEYDKGNYIICGGDFNKDLLGNSGELFGVSGEDYTWAQPFPMEYLEGTAFSLIAGYDEKNPVPSCRNCDEAYNPGQFCLIVDGFIVSDNINVTEAETIDTGFAYSDHNPVMMKFNIVG